MKILIGGDSWELGEWPQETNHRGIWQYFEEYRKYFWPDGSHPNRHGHKVLYDFILKNLNIG
jgi:hypothetical protein